MFLNNQQVTKEIKRKIKKFLKNSDNENMTIQNLWDTAKAVLRGKFIAIQSYNCNKSNTIQGCIYVYIKKQEKHRIDNLTLQLKQPQKKKKKPKLAEGKKS